MESTKHIWLVERMSLFQATKALCSSRAIMLFFAVGVSLTTLQVFQRYIVCQQDELLNRSISFRGKGLKVCRTPGFTSKANKKFRHQILYQCAGPNYDIFAKRMMSFADNEVLHGPTWGRRDYPLEANSTVLMLGNSHTRQVGVEMVCQYSSVLRSTWRNERSDLTIFEFDNNSTLHLLTNTPIVYSYEWKNLLEVVLGKRLREFDAIVLGLFNQFPGKVTTNFDKGMIERSKDLSNVDYVNIYAPTPWRILAEFDGHMAIVSMFSKWDQKWIELEKIAASQSNRVKAINARKYVPILGECGSDDRLGNGECLSDNVQRDGMRLPAGMHRCVGAHGGHPDLIAWEVIEFLHTITERPLVKPTHKPLDGATNNIQAKSSIKATGNDQPLPKVTAGSSQLTNDGVANSNFRPAMNAAKANTTIESQNKLRI